MTTTKLQHPEAVLARWPGTCPRCSKAIERGSMIVCAAGRVWLHESCATVNTPPDTYPTMSVT